MSEKSLVTQEKDSEERKRRKASGPTKKVAGRQKTTEKLSQQ
jgi:hypothetical protein